MTKKTKIILISAAAVILLAVVTVLIIFIFTKKPPVKIVESTTEASEPEQVVYPPLEPIVDFSKYTSVNPDVKGYISIPKTGLDEIIVQSSNGERDYYLHKNWRKSYSAQGSVYFDNSFDLKNPLHKIWVIYGHNNADGSGFPELHLWNPARTSDSKALEFYKKHHLARIDTVDEMAQWKIFAVFAASANNKEDGDSFYYFYKFNFENPERYQKYIDDIRIRSSINTPVEVTTDDTIALLSTCISDGYNYYGNRYKNWRCVMALRRVRPGENPEFDAGLAQINENPLMPDIWHKNTGKSKPEEVPPIPGEQSEN